MEWKIPECRTENGRSRQVEASFSMGPSTLMLPCGCGHNYVTMSSLCVVQCSLLVNNTRYTKLLASVPTRATLPLSHSEYIQRSPPIGQKGNLTGEGSSGEESMLPRGDCRRSGTQHCESSYMLIKLSFYSHPKAKGRPYCRC